MKVLIINAINEKSLTIQNLNPNNFNNLIQVIQNDFAKNYYFEVNLAIESYGKDDISYGSHLNFTRKQIFERLMNRQNGEDLLEEAKRRAESKDAEETLKGLYTRANNNYNGLNNLNTFTYFYNTINSYKNDLALESKKIKEMIAGSKYKEEINLFLNEKVDSLLNSLNNYYTQINNRFSSLKSVLNQNMSYIRTYLNDREYYTEYYLYYEYSRIKQRTKQINNKYSNYIQKFQRQIEYQNDADHMTNYAYASIYNINEYAEFKMEFIYNGAVWERPKVKATIVGKSRPGNVDLDFNGKCGRCCYEGQIYNISLKDSNFTTTVEYDMKTSNIKINTFTNIEKSYYTEIIYRKEKLKKKIEEDYDGIYVPYQKCSDEENITIYMNDTKEISAKHFSSGPKNIPI